MTRQTLRRTAPIAAALALGGGAGAAIYAASSGSSGTQNTVVASVPAQSAATVSTTTPLTQLYKNVSPGVVDITVTSSSAGGAAQAEGSGFVIDTSGDIVTNQHVVAGATSIKVRFQDGTVEKATLVGTDQSTDIAVIKVSGDSSLLHPLTFGSSSSLQVGDSSSGTGALVSTVKADTPASKAGLKAGDVITAIDGATVANADDLTAKINAHKPNQKVTLTVTRSGKSLSIDVTLGVRPS